MGVSSSKSYKINITPKLAKAGHAMLGCTSSDKSMPGELESLDMFANIYLSHINVSLVNRNTH